MITIDSIKRLGEKQAVETITGKCFITIPVDINLIMDLPQIEEKTYYKKNMSQSMKERLNLLGNRMMIYYDVQTRNITEVVVNIAHLVMVTYGKNEDIQTVIDKLIKEQERD